MPSASGTVYNITPIFGARAQVDTGPGDGAPAWVRVSAKQLNQEFYAAVLKYGLANGTSSSLYVARPGSGAISPPAKIRSAELCMAQQNGTLAYCGHTYTFNY